jgi:hypothetical protein
MSAVNISGTFSKDERPNNGLEQISADLVADELRPRIVIGVVVPHKFVRKPGEGTVPTVRFEAIEVVTTDDDVETVHEMMDRLRKERHQQPVMRSLFDGERDDQDDGDPDGDAPE